MFSNINVIDTEGDHVRHYDASNCNVLEFQNLQ